MGSGFRTFTAGEILTASNVQNYLQDQVVMTFAGSAARSSAIGTANFEEGMTSYLTDTDKMEVYNGTNWVSVAPTTSQGLTLINTTSFSAVSAVNLTANIFSATYDNYIVLVNATFGAASGTLQARMRASGTDNTSNEYIRQFMRGTSTSVATNTDTGTFFNIGDLVNTYRNIFKIELNQPAAAVVTTGHVIGSRSGYVNLTTLTHNVATAFDSITIYPDTSTITGKIQVFGYSL
jgi:hypothetical protein